METEAYVVLGAGCFWCVEAVFERIPGVVSVESGYAGGDVEDPTYEAVCAGSTGHAEVAKISYDPNKVSYEEILNVFWKSHDPTTLNRQGGDVGTQYRSVIFTGSESEKRSAEESMKKAQADFDAPIVTEISPLDIFYPAESYHQDYYKNNSTAPYCMFVIRPKLKKLKLD
jgi:peptide-methionine (S)-S-oxide reductase